MIPSILFALLLEAMPAIALDSNLLAQPGFESGTAGWSFWANSSDSASFSASTDARTGSGAVRIDQRGHKDWSLSATGTKVNVLPGQLWTFSVAVRRDSLGGEVSASFVTRDSSGGVMDWSVSSAEAPVDTGWIVLDARIAIAHGVATIQPRLIGWEQVRVSVDDARFVLSENPPASQAPLVVRNDSLRLRVDPLDLSMVLVDSIGGDSLSMGALADFRLDSAVTQGDSLVLRLRHLGDGFQATLSLKPVGGALRMRLAGSGDATLTNAFVFPGEIPTKAGQRMAIPRGTGLSWPTDGPLSSRWSLKEIPFWDWQVSQALAGATDGKTGFVISLGSPANARASFVKEGSAPSRPRVIQVPAKGLFGKAREAVVAPLRGGGFAEMGQRRRRHLEALGQIKDWKTRVAENPEVAKLRGASDWWVVGSGWSWKSFDTLRWSGVDRALIHWTWASKSVIDSLVSRGFVVSTYDDWADAFPADTSATGREYASGSIIQEDGTPMKGWLEIHEDGTTRQAREICSARHPHLARVLAGGDRAATSRNGRFVDVELSIALTECWSGDHPVDRDDDLKNRTQALSIVKDSLHYVTGSEQTRDAVHAVVEYGEGPMSIASVANAGYDWSTPVPPEGTMDSMSLDPALRVPLLPLTDHDAFAPTWYTGDGQSKVPSRWDDKDAWNILYATMPLIQPVDRTMFDSLRPRYLRSVIAVGALLTKCQFEPMTGWDVLSEDRRVQRARYGNGWTVDVNFDKLARQDAGMALPAKGWYASGAGESVERTVLDGAVRTRVRMADRWFLDPEGTSATLDGVRTAGAVFIKREDDSTLSLSLLGVQSQVELSAASLPWASTSLRAFRRGGGGTSVALSDMGDGWARLSAPAGERFFLLRGNFGDFQKLGVSRGGLSGLALQRSPRGWRLRWFQESAGIVALARFDVRGNRLISHRVAGVEGLNTLDLTSSSTPTWIRITTPSGTRVLAIPPGK